ncbi:unnamed protein product [Rhizophagus irregularis]|nr:unnamed protein product [Rhizophagus irregularis]CAB5384827.1 unnamed protein product [Rhizophagus irregularis]
MDNVNFVSTSSMEITFSAPRPNKDKEENKEENKGKSQEISKAGRITLSASRPNLSMDNYNGTQSQQAVNVSWKTNQESINLVFYASVTAINWKDRESLCRIQQKDDRHLLPRDQYGNVILKLED